MITIFNRQLLMTTVSTEHMVRVRDLLLEKGLEVLVKNRVDQAINLKSAAIANQRSFGQQRPSDVMMAIYVKRSESAHAVALLKQSGLFENIG